jgi:type I restriction enzyme M protein
MTGAVHDLPDPAALFKAADILRGSVDAAEYKHLVLGLLFLKYVSESFEQRREQLRKELSDPDSDEYVDDEDERAEMLDDKDEYLAENVFFIPAGARWSQEDPHPEKQGLLQAASLPDIGQRIDRALELIERENDQLPRGILPRIYARAPLSAEKLGALVETIGRIPFGSTKEARDYLGRTYEYFIATFAAAEGRNAGEYYTPKSVTRLLVEMLEPYQGRVFDPACGSCGLFIQSARFVEEHGKSADQLAIYGQEMNQATWRIGQMNLAIHGLSGDVRYTENGSLLDDAFPNLKADFVMANPPFNQDPWGASAVKGDVRFYEHGLPPDSNANFAWMLHFLHHLSPAGRAGYVMANGSLTTTSNNEGNIRESLVRAGVVDCIVALPAQLFFQTGIPVCLWFLDRSRPSSGDDNAAPILFVDARSMGQKISRTQIELTSDEIERITATYHAWRRGDARFANVSGFAYSATFAEVQQQSFALSPGRYVGAPEGEEEEVEFEERMAELTEAVAADLDEAVRLTDDLRGTLRALGYEV